MRQIIRNDAGNRIFKKRNRGRRISDRNSGRAIKKKSQPLRPLTPTASSGIREAAASRKNRSLRAPPRPDAAPARSPPVHRRYPTPPHRPPSPTAGVRPAEPRRPADAVRRRATTRRSKPANRFPHRYSTRSPAAAPPAGAIPRYTGSNPGRGTTTRVP